MGVIDFEGERYSTDLRRPTHHVAAASNPPATNAHISRYRITPAAPLTDTGQG